MSKITFAEDAWKEYLYWQSQDKKTLKKINSLLKSIQREPYAGEGKPEPLKSSPEGNGADGSMIKTGLFTGSAKKTSPSLSARDTMMTNKPEPSICPALLYSSVGL